MKCPKCLSELKKNDALLIFDGQAWKCACGRNWVEDTGLLAFIQFRSLEEVDDQGFKIV